MVSEPEEKAPRKTSEIPSKGLNRYYFREKGKNELIQERDIPEREQSG